MEIIKADDIIRQAPRLARNTWFASSIGLICSAVLFSLDWDWFFVQVYFLATVPFALFAAPTLEWLNVRQTLFFAVLLSLCWPLAIGCAGGMQFVLVFPLVMAICLILTNLLLFKKTKPLLSFAFGLAVMAVPFVIFIVLIALHKIADHVAPILAGLGFSLLNLLFYSFIKMNLTKNEEDSHRRR